MKKGIRITILVVAFIVLSSFCRFHTVSKYDIVSGISIDYKNGEYNVVCEISMPSSNNDFGSKATYVKGNGFTIAKALENTGLKSQNQLYLDSVQLYLISDKAFENDELKQYLKSENVNLRAVAVLCEGDAADVLYSEKESNERAKSLSLCEKLKSICREQKLPLPHVVTLLKTGGEIYINRDKLAQRRTDI